MSKFNHSAQSAPPPEGTVNTCHCEEVPRRSNPIKLNPPSLRDTSLTKGGEIVGRHSHKYKCQDSNHDLQILSISRGEIDSPTCKSQKMSYNSDMTYHYLNKCKLSFAKQTVNSLPSCLPVLRKLAAFTLAETLITLAIIGVVAAMTISTLITTSYERRTVAKLKKVYSQLSTAYSQATYEKGPIKEYLAPYPNWYATESHQAFRDYFASYFNVSKKGNYVGAWPHSIFTDSNSYASFTGIDGTVYIFRLLPDNCRSTFNYETQTCGTIFVDLSGYKNDNFDKPSGKRILAKNIFAFYATKDKILPMGFSKINDGTLSCYSNGYECTNWVITNENLDYLHCNDLSYKGKRKCK